MSEYELWKQDAEAFGWIMPTAPRWKRLPVIRHLRAKKAQFAVMAWYSTGPGMIGLPAGYDEWVLYGIWHGLERPEL